MRGADRPGNRASMRFERDPYALVMQKRSNLQWRLQTKATLFGKTDSSKLSSSESSTLKNSPATKRLGFDQMPRRVQAFEVD